MRAYQAIQGKLPKKTELIKDWKESHFLEFFDIMNFMTVDGKVVNSEKKVKELEDWILNGKPSFKTEILYRINVFTGPDYNRMKFYNRLTAINRMIGVYFRQNPIVITEGIKEKIKDNPRVSWMLSHYKAYQTSTGAEIAMPANQDDTKPIKDSAPVLNPHVQYLNSMVKVVSILEALVDGVTVKDIKGMDVKDKISSIVKMAAVLKDSMSAKPTAGVMNQINIFKADIKDVEKAMMDFTNRNK